MDIFNLLFRDIGKEKDEENNKDNEQLQCRKMERNLGHLAVFLDLCRRLYPCLSMENFVALPIQGLC